MTIRLLEYGETAILVEADPGRIAGLVERLTAGAVAEVAEVVPAARTVLVRFDSPAALARRRDELDRLAGGVPSELPRPDPRRTVTIDVVYDGPDLAEVARLTGLGVDEVVAAHTGAPWRVAFGGFAPGFAYLDGGDPRLAVPRRAEPRPSVAAGSVGLAGGFSGVYPRSSPGGWQLIGHSEVELWDADREPAALLTPGRWVRFVAVTS